MIVKFRNRIIIALVFFASIGYAQEPKLVDAVILNDGSKIVGQLQNADSVNAVRILTNFNGEMTISLSEIKRIYPGYTPDQEFVEEVGDLDFSFEGAVLTNDEHLSPSMQIALHKYVTRYIAVGLGTGINIYNYTNEQMNFPLFVSARAFLSSNRTKPYFEVNAGYGFTSKNEEIGITDATGGIVFNPKFGIRIGKDDIKVALFTGFKFQKSTYIYQGWGGEYNQKINHRRIEFGLGIHF